MTHTDAAQLFVTKRCSWPEGPVQTHAGELPGGYEGLNVGSGDEAESAGARSPLSPADVHATPAFRNDPAFLKRIGVMVPCHRSAEEIGATLNSLLLYFEPENIVVCDNANSLTPMDDTAGRVAEISERVTGDYQAIKYIFIPEGHKTQALCFGALSLGDRVDYVMHIDDDTILSDQMVFDESLFTNDPKLAAVSYARIVDHSTPVCAYVDFFYKRSDHWGYAQGRMATRPYIPGPCGIWRRDYYLRMMEHHPFLPFGEDIFGSYHALMLGWRFQQELRCTVKTFAPPVLGIKLFDKCLGGIFVNRVQGYGAATIWKQRAHRWTVSGCRVLPLSIYLFFAYRATKDVSAAVWFRLFKVTKIAVFTRIVGYPSSVCPPLHHRCRSNNSQ